MKTLPPLSVVRETLDQMLAGLYTTPDLITRHWLGLGR